ncbi:MAG: glycoside hydrolase family 32 protein [Janthinobacterium lividum]
MLFQIKFFFYFIVLSIFIRCKNSTKVADHGSVYSEHYRPQFHFSPQKNWMNDPNGMVYFEGTYHLFFQQNPVKNVMGAIHWGHATSTDLVHWQQQPTALYPDSLGYIFSGSAVADVKNTAGFNKDGKTALVALFTSHNPKGEKDGKTTYENQSMAYTLDKGKTWTKFANNPVLKNPGIKDFRDPKVRWYEPQQKWVMALAVKDRVHFYSSKNLKNWVKESEFGVDKGNHGGVWECPDLIEMDHQGKKEWVLLVSINPGGPNGGSATQYFTGNFDGKTFVSADNKTKWIDYGTDNYAGVTWSNSSGAPIFLGWMSNWQYGQLVPTATWRGTMTIPRKLSIKTVSNTDYVVSEPVDQLNKIMGKTITLDQGAVKNNFDLTSKVDASSGLYKLQFSSKNLDDFSIVLANDAQEHFLIGYDKKTNQYYTDRTKSGKVDFEKGFAQKHYAPRIATGPAASLTLLVDHTSAELFADNGLTCLTTIFFPKQPYNHISIKTPGNFQVDQLSFAPIQSIWKK